MFRIAMLRLWIAASIVLLVALTCSPLLARTWTDQRGRTISGKFVRLNGDKVVILSGGKIVTPKLSSLSQADQNYVRDVLAGKQPADENGPGKASGGLDLQTEESGEGRGGGGGNGDGNGDGNGEDSGSQDNPFDASARSSDAEADDEDEDEDDNESVARRGASGLPVRTTAVQRDWSTAKGPVRGTFVRYFDGNVILKRGGKVEQHSFWTLSDSDQQYVRDLLAARGTPDAIPNSPPASLARENGAASGLAGSAPIGAGAMPGMSAGMPGVGVGIGGAGIGGAGIGPSRGSPLGMGGPPGMRGPGAMGGMPGMPGGLPGGMAGQGIGQGLGGPRIGMGGPLGADPLAGVPGGMPGLDRGVGGRGLGARGMGSPGAGNLGLGGSLEERMAGAGIGPRLGPSGLGPPGLGPSGIGPNIEAPLGSGMGSQPTDSMFARNSAPHPTVAPPPDFTISEEFVTPAERGATIGGMRPYDDPFAGEQAPPPEAVALGVMIVVLSIACPAILFIAFVGFLIWLIVKMTSRPSYT